MSQRDREEMEVTVMVVRIEQSEESGGMVQMEEIVIGSSMERWKVRKPEHHESEKLVQKLKTDQTVLLELLQTTHPTSPTSLFVCFCKSMNLCI